MFPNVASGVHDGAGVGRVAGRGYWKVAAGAVPAATEVNSVGPARPIRPTGSVPTERPAIAMRSGVAVLGITPETKDEPCTQNDAAKEEEHSKERPKNQPQGDRR
jgi:hypothetical protein